MPNGIGAPDGIDWQTSMMLRSPDIPVFLPLRAAAADPVADGVSSGYYCCNYYYCLLVPLFLCFITVIIIKKWRRRRRFN